MKTLIPLTALAALLSSGSLPAQTPAYSKPSGYTTKQLTAGFNLVSVTLQKPVIFTGAISSINQIIFSQETASVLSFATAHNLPVGKMLILEVINGSGVSDQVVQEFSVYSGNEITLPSTITELAPQNIVAVREAATLEEIFGTILASGSNSASSDIVWVPSGSGKFDRYYRRTPLSGAAGWRKLGNPESNAPNTPIIYLDGLFVEIKPGVTSNKTITVTGQVKTDSAKFAIQPGFNLVGTVFPVGTTLTSSGLQTQLTSGSNLASSDVIWVSTSPGVFVRYYYRTPLSGVAGWRMVGSPETTVDGSSVSLPEAIFIERKGRVGKDILITSPASYSNL